MLIILIPLIALATKRVEYRLWKNYGQIIFDYSLNNMSALNGNTIYQDNLDCSYTDREFYFYKNQTHIMMPSHNYSSLLGTLDLSYTVIIWLNVFEETGKIFYRHMSSNYWQIQIMETTDPGSAILTIFSYDKKYDTHKIQSFKSKLQIEK